MLSVSCLTLLTAKPTNAQSIPKPSVPEFTIEHYQVENRSVVVNIKNQPFIPYSVNGSQVNLYYQIRFKGHLEGEEAWNVQYSAWISHSAAKEYPKQSDSEYTILPLQLYSTSSQGLDNGDKWDIQVEAMVGNISLVEFYGVTYWTFEGEKSDWSRTWILNLADASVSVSTSPNPTLTSMPNYGPTSSPTPIVPEFYWLIILPLFIFTLSIVVLIRKRKVSLSK
jgi:hypothetical protein